MLDAQAHAWILGRLAAIFVAAGRIGFHDTRGAPQFLDDNDPAKVQPNRESAVKRRPVRGRARRSPSEWVEVAR